jgi:hypothetical protein
MTNGLRKDRSGSYKAKKKASRSYKLNTLKAFKKAVATKRVKKAKKKKKA